MQPTATTGTSKLLLPSLIVFMNPVLRIHMGLDVSTPTRKFRLPAEVSSSKRDLVMNSFADSPLFIMTPRVAGFKSFYDENSRL
ncbi:hypothetical protein J21TS7_03730 [Paenibacillus cineris]|uniref:Uncharacterized protein n=1 Tax=Paenibacillus cineris TaxID=237530 RepID=A0ABQ4L6X5_9BACL|nr:hypothetical protein J21TS7_03730 [Paenibacillus cineris]